MLELEAKVYNINRGQNTELVNMLFGEWDMDTALAVRFEEGIETGMERGLKTGIERGIKTGIERGLKKGIERGSEKRAERAAINGLKKGLSVEDASEISELSIDRVKELQARL